MKRVFAWRQGARVPRAGAEARDERGLAAAEYDLPIRRPRLHWALRLAAHWGNLSTRYATTRNVVITLKQFYDFGFLGLTRDRRELMEFCTVCAHCLFHMCLAFCVSSSEALVASRELPTIVGHGHHFSLGAVVSLSVVL